MTGFNMPPGCSPRDIPGNRPEDQAEEAFYDWVFETVGGRMSEGDTDKLAEALWLKMGEAYQQGYSQGQADEQMAKEFATQVEDDNSPLPDHGDWVPGAARAAPWGKKRD